ncbi:hypothetical protein AVEN_39423-1, partial [Araneus ventricosus]
PLSPLLRCAPCLNSDSTASPDKVTPAAVPAQKLLQLINDCEPVNERILVIRLSDAVVGGKGCVGGSPSGSCGVVAGALQELVPVKSSYCCTENSDLWM